MARPRTPTKVLEARGSFRAHPERKRQGEPVVTTPLGPAPDSFNDREREAWYMIASQAPTGVLTSADAGAVEVAATLFAEFRRRREAGEPPDCRLIGQLRGALGQFGMTPSDRARLNIAPPAVANPFLEYASK